MYINNQNFMILGVSKSGYAVAKHILEHGGKCFLYEDFNVGNVKNKVDELVEAGAELVKRENFVNLIDNIDALIISPGVPINHEVAVRAKRSGVKILSELEFGYNCLLPTIVGVTGTNGKTTTCSLIKNILDKAEKDSLLVGNIGIPITSKLDIINSNKICITEVSSFQLESVSGFCPHISCILNIKPDHLDRHYSMDNYIFLKKRIFSQQKTSEYCVLNYDDEIVKNLEPDVKSKLIWVSCNQVVRGSYLLNNSLYYNQEEIIQLNQLPIDGKHNVYNALFAIAVCKLLGVDNQAIKMGLQEFKGVKHRIEKIFSFNQVDYYDDSKATNVASTLVAIDCMKNPTILILGGSEKGEDYLPLFEKIKHSNIKHIVLTGQSKFKMLDCAGAVGVGNLTLTSEFDHAVKIAQNLAEAGDNVLLSPSCASFDFFNNYEERGDRFVKLIGESFETNK